MKLVVEIEEKRYLYYKELCERSQTNGEVVSTIEHIIGAGVPLQDKEVTNVEIDIAIQFLEYYGKRLGCKDEFDLAIEVLKDKVKEAHNE